MRVLKWVGWSFAALMLVNLAFAYFVIPVFEGRKAQRALRMEMMSTLAEVGAPGNAAKVTRLLDRGPKSTPSATAVPRLLWSLRGGTTPS